MRREELMTLTWDGLSLNSSQELSLPFIHFINIYRACAGARGAAVDRTDDISALMELIVLGKDKSWEDT